MVFVEVPEVGRKAAAGEAVAVVESVKAASDVFAPVSGEVVEANADLAANFALVNEDAEGKAWFFKIKLVRSGRARQADGPRRLRGVREGGGLMGQSRLLRAFPPPRGEGQGGGMAEHRPSGFPHP